MSHGKRWILMNAFHPAKEVDDPEFFAGRAREVAALTDSLHVSGSCPIIYGDRGLGKTSLAVQIKYIAMGDEELLRSLGIEDRALSEDRQFITFMVTCTDETPFYQGTRGILQLLINAAEEADFSTISENKKADRLAGRTVSKKISLKAFEAGSVKTYEREKGRDSYRNLSRTEKLHQLIKIIVESYNRPVLFIIDEFDRVNRKHGLASFIKATSGEDVKFILVGIASNVSQLLGDHLSLERSLVPVIVPAMNEGELYEIIEKAEAYLKDHGVGIGFDHFASLKIVEFAAGYPWFVHVIGQSALVLAADEGRELVVESDVVRAVHELTGNQFAHQFAETYRNVVRNSYQREKVLRTFAEWRGVDIPTSEIYRKLKTELGVSNPSVYRKQLNSNEYRRVITTPQTRNRGWVRFSNEMFKVYVRLRPSIYTDIDKEVWEATKNRSW